MVDWTDASGTPPLSYVYQYSWSSDTEADGDFSHPSFTSGTLTSSEITVDPAGNDATDYYWHVRAIDPDGNVGDWSDIFFFTLDHSGTGTSTPPTTGTSTSATTTETIVVTENDLLGTTSPAVAASSSAWFFYDDVTDTIKNILGSFVNAQGRIAAAGGDGVFLVGGQFKLAPQRQVVVR